jgi:hypothetical protein
LSWSFKECTIYNLYGSRFRSLCRMHSTLLSEKPNAWACLLPDRLRSWPIDTNIQAIFLGMWNQDGWWGGFVTHDTAFFMPLLYRWWIAFRNGASSQFISQWNQRWVSVTDPIWIQSSTAHMFSNCPTLHVD